jgi:hypothetical protein
MGEPLKAHWYVNGASPVAETLNVAFELWMTVWLVGCAVIIGGLSTVKEAVELDAEPNELITTTE